MGRTEIEAAELQQNFAQPDRIYAPFAFWFWNAPIDAQRAADMAAEMCRQGLNPGYVFAVGPPTLSRGLPREQWLSPLWFDAFEKARQAAEKAGGYIGFCNEYTWPSGQAAGRVLADHPELAAVSLKWDVRQVAAGQAVELPASFFTVAVELSDAKHIVSATLEIVGAGDGFKWQAPGGTGAWRVYSFHQYHHAGMDGSPINYLDDRLADIFLAMAHAPYSRNLGDHLGKSIPGIFLDHEGDYGWKLAWSDHLARAYRQRYGRDIRLWMPLLLDLDMEGLWAKARWEWFDVVSDIYADFFAKITRWCEQRHMYCTGHFWEEFLTMEAESAGDFFKVQRALSMPGTDSLGTRPLFVREFKEAQSVSEFEGRRCACEILTTIGHGQTPVLVKRAMNAVTAWGVSHMIQAGAYTDPELNKTPWPPHNFAHDPCWPYMHQLSDFARRASYVNSHGHTVPDVLLVCPMDSIWALSGEWLFNAPTTINYFSADPLAETVDQVKRIEECYSDAINRLTAARVEFLIADRHYLRKMSAKDGRLTLGDFQFKAVVLPPMLLLPRDVAEKIVAFAETGGPVYMMGELPAGSSDCGMNDPVMLRLMESLGRLPSVVDCTQGLAAELARGDTALASRIAFLSGEFAMLQLHRRIDGREFFWLANNTGVERECKVSIRGVAGSAEIWDCETGQVRLLAAEQAESGCVVKLRFDPYEAYWLVVDPSSTSRCAPSRGATAVLRSMPLDRWRVRVLRQGQPSVSWKVAKFFTIPWQAQWLKVTGVSLFRYDFNLSAACVDAQIQVTADESFVMWVNGRRFPSYDWDRLWQQVSAVDITEALHEGRNVIAIEASKQDGQRGGVILQGQAKLSGGATVVLRSDASWRSSSGPLSQTWQETDYEAAGSAWTAAESLGTPPVTPWIDVAPDLLDGAPRPLESWLNWGLDYFSGYVDYTSTFELGGIDGAVWLDLGKVKYVAEVFVNDRNVGARTWPPFKFDITDAVKAGANTVRVRVGNLVINELIPFDDKKLLETWGWKWSEKALHDFDPASERPPQEAFDAGLFGPVSVTLHKAMHT